MRRCNKSFSDPNGYFSSVRRTTDLRTGRRTPKLCVTAISAVPAYNPIESKFFRELYEVFVPPPRPANHRYPDKHLLSFILSNELSDTTWVNTDEKIAIVATIPAVVSFFSAGTEDGFSGLVSSTLPPVQDKEGAFVIKTSASLVLLILIR